ncbi:MAG: histidine kinase [Cytophagaceae bacterium]|nr:histidine kinase [Cytophagaceae bacterium]
MSNYRKIVVSKPLQVLFHLAFWGFFLALPFLLRSPQSSSRPPRTPFFDEYIILINLLDIPLFYLNAYVLIPKVLKREGVGWYVVSAVLSITAFLILHAVMAKTLLFPESTNLRISIYTVFPIIFLFAVSTSFRILSDYIEDERQRKELENSRLKAELNFLRSQISPHFMFNVLNSLVSLNRKKSDLVEPVIINLSDLLRYMLYESDDAKVALSKEVKYLHSYIELQQLRFGEDVRLDLQLPEHLPGGFIEPMLLIPFVENAYKHGIGLITDPTIRVQLDVYSDQLTFRVENKISSTPTQAKDGASGIGLANVRRRLSLLYPDSHTLGIHQRDGLFCVDLVLHFKPEPQQVDGRQPVRTAVQQPV